MTVFSGGGNSAAVLDRDERISSAGDMLDKMMEASYNYGCAALVTYRENLGQAFFDLKSGVAGEILQKFSNYNMKIAIIGDFGDKMSAALRAFMYESNRSGRIFFKGSIEEGLKALGVNMDQNV